jgi:ComF family protein
MFLRVIQAILDIFLIEKIKPSAEFEENFLDRTAHYREELSECYLDGVFIITYYSEEFKYCLERFKYHRDRTIVDILLPYLHRLFQYFFHIGKNEKHIITIVPMFFLQSFVRGYNQSYLLGKELLRETTIPFLPLVKKTRWTRYQARLTKKERHYNLQNVFSIDEKYLQKIQGATIFLGDDVISTGSTANSIAKTLKQAGAKEIIGLFLASQKTDDN